MDLGLKGKRALVAGASAGLGAAAAEALAAEGATVIINSRSEERLKTTADRIAARTGHCPVTSAGDLSITDDLRRVVEQAGVVDILVSNTGGPPPGAFLDHTPEKFEAAAHLVLDAAVGLTRAFLPGMVARKWGRLIYITSIGVLQPVDHLILSNTYRAAVTGFCKTISNNYAQFGVTANCVCPGYTGTERLQSLAQNIATASGRRPEEVMAEFAAITPARRVGRPEELAGLIAFLSSDRAAFITGASIPVDGGLNKSLV